MRTWIIRLTITTGSPATAGSYRGGWVIPLLLLGGCFGRTASHGREKQDCAFWEPKRPVALVTAHERFPGMLLLYPGLPHLNPRLDGCMDGVVMGAAVLVLYV
jgi:hypothetical protein